MALLSKIAMVVTRPTAIRTSLGAVLLAGIAFLPGPVLAQTDMSTLMNRLNRLENEVQTLNRQVYRGGPAPAPVAGAPAGGGGLPSSLAADFEVRLSRLESEMRNLTGQYEEAAYGVTQLRERLEKLSSDLDFRLMQIEDRLNAVALPESGSVAAAPAPAAPAQNSARPAPANQTAGGAAPAQPAQPRNGQQQAALATGSVQQQYDQAFGLLRAADYPAAEAALSQFLKSHPNDPLAGNAQYWLAETYYVRGKFNEAAIAFAEGYQKHPKGAKAPDNLLKLGMSLAQLNQKNEACVALKQLNKDFPDAPATIKRRADQERGRMNCP